MKALFASLLLALSGSGAALAQSPSATPTPGVPVPGVVTCPYARLYTFTTDTNRPNQSTTPAARQGQTFDVLSGPRSTLSGDLFYETSIPIIETGPALSPHYWIQQRCVNIPVK